MRWEHAIDVDARGHLRNLYKSDFAGYKLRIWHLGPFRYKLWCYDISESYHWTLRGAKRQAEFDMLEYGVTMADELDYRIGKLEAANAPENGAPI